MPSLHPTLALLDYSGEMLMVFLLVLIFFGGEKLPEFARGLGKLIRDFKKAAAGVEEEIKRAMEEPKNEFKEIKRAMEEPKHDLEKIIAPPVFGTLDQLHEQDSPAVSPTVTAEPPPAQPTIGASAPAGPAAPATVEPAPPDATPAHGTTEHIHVTDTAKTPAAQPEAPPADQAK